MSLKQLSDWCSQRFGPQPVVADGSTRPFDIPWIVLDSTKAAKIWSWQPTTITTEILEGIAQHAEKNPDWLDLSAPR
jgi:CDP-paratose 2-epimerase